MDEQSVEQQPNDEETEDGEIDDLEDGEVKDDDDDEPLPPPQFFNRRSPPPKLADSQPLPPLSALPPRLPATGQSPGFGLAPSVRPEDVGICKFYLRGQCTWGTTCPSSSPPGPTSGPIAATTPTTLDESASAAVVADGHFRSLVVFRDERHSNRSLFHPSADRRYHCSYRRRRRSRSPMKALGNED
jgi:hypothetical protein